MRLASIWQQMLLDRRMPPRRARSKAEMGHVILLRHSTAAMKPLIAKLAIGVLVTTSATPALTNRANAEFLENRTLISQSGNTPETLSNVRFSTSKKFIVMPVADKSEIQSVRWVISTFKRYS